MAMAFIGILPGAAAGAREASPHGTSFPTDAEYEILYQRLEDLRVKEDWPALLDGLAEYIRLSERPAINAVVPSGQGLALGIRRLLADVAASLPPSHKARFRERLDAVLKQAWERSRGEPWASERRRLRHSLLRDYPMSSLYRAALEEEIDDALEAADWGRARQAAGALLDFTESGGAGDNAREPEASVIARASLVLAEVGIAAGSPPAAIAPYLDRLRALRDTGELGALPPPLEAEALRLLKDVAPAASAGEQAAARGARTPYRLGSVVWRQSIPTSRLRGFIEERSRSNPSGDISLPYNATARDDVIVFEHADRLTAVEPASLRVRWSILAARDEGFSELRSPLLGAAECFHVSGGTLHAVRLSDGSRLWEKTAVYDPAAKALRLAAGTEAGARKEAAAAPPPKGTARNDGGPGGNDRQKDEGAEKEGGGAEKPEQGPPEQGPELGPEQPAEPGPEGQAPGGKARKKTAAPPATPVCSLSPPVFCGGDLVLGVRVRFEQSSLFYAVCLERNGGERWTTFLGAAHGGNYLGLAGAVSPPRVDEGKVYLLTNQGLLAALDAVDGALLWLTEYPRLDARGKQEGIRSADRWQPNPILAVGESLLFAPQDAASLIAADKQSGEVLWRSPREEYSTLLGADERACFVAGQRVAAMAHSGDERGQVLWSFAPAEKGSLPMGRAVLTPDAILVPERMTLLRLSPGDGSLLSRTLWGFAGGGGNLLLAGELLAVTSPEALLLYGRKEKEEEALARLPAGKPEAYLQRARIHLKNSEVAAGLEALRAWTESVPPAPAPNSERDHLQLDLAEMTRFLSRTSEGKPRARELLQARLRLETTPERKVEAGIELGEKLLEENDPAAALAAFHQAIAHDKPPVDYSPDGYLRVRAETYLRDRIAELRRTTPDAPTRFADQEKLAQESLTEARKKSVPSYYHEVPHLHPYTRAAMEAYLDLYTLYHDRLSFDQAAKVLGDYLQDEAAGRPTGGDSPGRGSPGGKGSGIGNPSGPGEKGRPPERAGEIVRVKLLLADLLARTGRCAEARRVYEDLEQNHGDAAIRGVPGLSAGERVREYAVLRLKDPGLRDCPEDTQAQLRFPVRMSWRSPADLQAANRAFLSPEGIVPEGLEECFLTQALEVLECRRLADGLPVWKVELEMIPGFVTDPSGIRQPRTGRRAFSAAYVGSLLILKDHSNLFALEAARGVVRWHVPFGNEDGANRPGPAGLIRRLRESLRGFAAGKEGVFAVSSEKIQRFTLEGAKVWEHDLTGEYEPAVRPAYLAGTRLFVHAQRPFGIRIYDVETGAETASLGAVEGFVERLAEDRDPVHLPDDRLLLTFPNEIKLFDLRSATFSWTYKTFPLSQMEEVAYFPEAPGECIVFIVRKNKSPAMVCLSLEDGGELWRYEKFDARRASFNVHRDGNRFYVLHGDDRTNLLALELRPGNEVDRPLVVPAWPSEVRLGTDLSGRPNLLIGGDSLVVVEPAAGSLNLFDKTQGGNRPALARAINAFLADKGNLASALLRGKLVLLTDKGDCAFEAAPVLPGGAPNAAGAVDITTLRAFLADPGSLETATRLALQYFRSGDSEAALNVLGRSILSENVLAENGRRRRYLLGYLLDGIKEEHMRDQIPEIATHRLPHPPAVDGELNDAWDLASRVHVDLPRHVGVVPAPGQVPEWDGDEDLSATLYTGWDEKFFYFALDVSDDSLFPYDRDAEQWKGDCLIIGIDPLGDGGHTMKADDQLMTLALTMPKRNKKDKEKQEQGEEGKDQEEEEAEDEESKPEGLFSVRKKDDDSGAIYEVALPWSSFGRGTGITPVGGQTTFGLSLLLTDDDSGQGATKTLSLNSCHLLPRSQKNNWIWRYVVPDYFPKVKLE